MISLLIFILILVALIWVHELGHFSAAKLFNIRVDEFAIGFPPRLLRLRWGETDYTFNLLLVGGFVRIYGEDPSEVGDPRALTAKSRPVQAAVMVAGIFFNIVFAWLALSAGYIAGMPMSPDSQTLGTVTNSRPTILAVAPDSPAQKAGVAQGDIIEMVETASEQFDARTLNTDRQAEGVHSFITSHADESLVLHISRAGEEKNFVLRAEENAEEGRKIIGVEIGDVGILRLPVHLAAAQGAITAYQLTLATAGGLGAFLYSIVTGQADFSQVAGPVGIAGVGSQAVSMGFASAVLITALISVNLAVINILPVPGLDGGRLLIIAIEGILRRPISPRLSTYLTLAGFGLLILLMIVVTASDIARLVG